MLLIDRRSFLVSFVAAAAGSGAVGAAQLPHPTPRPGVDGGVPSGDVDVRGSGAPDRKCNRAQVSIARILAMCEPPVSGLGRGLDLQHAITAIVAIMAATPADRTGSCGATPKRNPRIVPVPSQAPSMPSTRPENTRSFS